MAFDIGMFLWQWENENKIEKLALGGQLMLAGPLETSSIS